MDKIGHKIATQAHEAVVGTVQHHVDNPGSSDKNFTLERSSVQVEFVSWVSFVFLDPSEIADLSGYVTFIECNTKFHAIRGLAKCPAGDVLALAALCACAVQKLRSSRACWASTSSWDPKSRNHRRPSTKPL